jgi:hypothetical protein
VSEIAAIAFADPGDFFDWGPTGVTVKSKGGLTPQAAPPGLRGLPDRDGGRRYHQCQTAPPSSRPWRSWFKHLGMYEADNEQVGKAAADAMKDAADSSTGISPARCSKSCARPTSRRRKGKKDRVLPSQIDDIIFDLRGRLSGCHIVRRALGRYCDRIQARFRLRFQRFRGLFRCFRGGVMRLRLSRGPVRSVHHQEARQTVGCKSCQAAKLPSAATTRSSIHGCHPSHSANGAGVVPLRTLPPT